MAVLFVRELQDVGDIGQIYGLVTESNEVLYTHICSNKSFAYGDLYGNRKERWEEIRKRFGEVEIVVE